MAERVTSSAGPEQQNHGPPPPVISPLVQRQTEEEEEDEEPLQLASLGPVIGAEIEGRLDRLRGSGRPLPEASRALFEARLGVDLGQVRLHTDGRAAVAADAVHARAFTRGQDVVFAAGQYAPETAEGQRLLAHELVHVVQQSAAEPGSRTGIMRAKGKVAQKIVGWMVKVGERKLVKTVTIYSEKELTTLLAQGYNVLVKRGKAQAKRIARKVWDENFIHHTGHIIRKTGKKGLSHFQPARQLVGRAGERGWHIFYSAAPVLFFADDVEAMEVYEDKYPGKSVAKYLTVTQYVGEDSWLSRLDWINPLELIAIGGDIGRDWDRERTKELKALVFNRVADDGSIQTYELDPEGHLVRVIIVGPEGEQKTLTADEYFTFLGQAAEGPAAAPAARDGTQHPSYSATFDADYRIYISKGGWDWDRSTQSFYLPADDAKRLRQIGEFYVIADPAIDYVYAYVHPRHRVTLQQPGFAVPGDMVGDYVRAASKEEFLQQVFASTLQLAKVKAADLWRAK